MRLLIRNRTKISNASPKQIARIIEVCSFPNPEYAKRKRLKYSTYGMDEYIEFWENTGETDSIIVPNGMISRIMNLGNVTNIVDKRSDFSDDPLDFGWEGRLYDYQKRTVRQVEAAGGGIVVGPPGSGKTEMGIAIAARFGQPAIWIVDSKDLLDQSYIRAVKHLALPDEAFGKIHAGKLEIGTHITFATWQSLTNKKREFYRRFGTLIFDECHTAGATVIFSTVVKFWAKHVVGLTATPERDDGLTPLEHAALGEIVAEISLDEVEATGQIIRPIAEIVPTEYITDTHPRKPGEYNAFLTEMFNDKKRNRFIVDTIAQKLKEDEQYNPSAIVISDRIDHCIKLNKLINKRYPHIKTGMYHGRIENSEERKRILKDANDGKITLLFAARLGSKGIDIKRSTHLFLVSGGRGAVNTFQRAGRVMRSDTATNKTISKVIDFFDQYVPILVSQGKSRMKTYDKLGIKVITPPNFKPIVKSHWSTKIENLIKNRKDLAKV